MGKAAGILPKSAERLLEIAHTNSVRLVRLVNDILDIEKLESGRAVFDLKRVDVGSLVGQMVEGIRGMAEGHQVKIRVEAAAAIGEVPADTDRLGQVITNLLSNAVKFSPPDDEVVVTIENGVDLVRISVRDHGPGISDEFKPRVFERFAQADATDARRKGGTGLGLSIVKEIVDRLSGEVGFCDAPGGGTVFHVELPVWAGPGDENAQARSPESSIGDLVAVSSRLAVGTAWAAGGVI
jgi:signal transduction histidine kinase